MRKSVLFLVAAASLMLLSLPAFAGELFPPTVAPEPATLALIASGIGAVAILRKTHSKK